MSWRGFATIGRVGAPGLLKRRPPAQHRATLLRGLYLRYAVLVGLATAVLLVLYLVLLCQALAPLGALTRLMPGSTRSPPASGSRSTQARRRWPLWPRRSMTCSTAWRTSDARSPAGCAPEALDELRLLGADGDVLTVYERASWVIAAISFAAGVLGLALLARPARAEALAAAPT